MHARPVRLEPHPFFVVVADAAAQVHTTVAITGLGAGVAENVMPPGGSIRLNFRLLPGDTIVCVGVGAWEGK